MRKWLHESLIQFYRGTGGADTPFDCAQAGAPRSTSELRTSSSRGPKNKINRKSGGQEWPPDTNAPREFWAQGERASPFFPRVGKGDVPDGFQMYVGRTVRHGMRSPAGEELL